MRANTSSLPIAAAARRKRSTSGLHVLPGCCVRGLPTARGLKRKRRSSILTRSLQCSLRRLAPLLAVSSGNKAPRSSITQRRKNLLQRGRRLNTARRTLLRSVVGRPTRKRLRPGRETPSSGCFIGLGIWPPEGRPEQNLHKTPVLSQKTVSSTNEDAITTHKIRDDRERHVRASAKIRDAPLQRAAHER